MVSPTGIIAVYIVTNRRMGTIYTGVTSDLIARIFQHKEAPSGFVKKWKCNRLVWYEQHDWMEAAIAREKSIKSYRRQNKINLIETMNPEWRDLYFELQG